jgi:hypothetical protein
VANTLLRNNFEVQESPSAAVLRSSPAASHQLLSPLYQDQRRTPDRDGRQGRRDGHHGWMLDRAGFLRRHRLTRNSVALDYGGAPFAGILQMRPGQR